MLRYAAHYADAPLLHQGYAEYAMPHYIDYIATLHITAIITHCRHTMLLLLLRHYITPEILRHYAIILRHAFRHATITIVAG